MFSLVITNGNPVITNKQQKNNLKLVKMKGKGENLTFNMNFIY
jgi:hypothetical protein